MPWVLLGTSGVVPAYENTRRDSDVRREQGRRPPLDERPLEPGEPPRRRRDHCAYLCSARLWHARAHGGIEGEKQAVRMYRAVFPDLQFTIEDMVGEGDRVAVAYTARGTHQGELMGVPATDKQVVVTLISILRIGNGKITEQRINWDTLGMLRQLGIVPSSGEGRA